MKYTAELGSGVVMYIIFHIEWFRHLININFITLIIYVVVVLVAMMSGIYELRR
jgi:hypothetical protein